MKIVTSHEGMIYAVGIATGKSAEGVDYQNILVSAEQKSSVRSFFSLFLDVNDQDMMKLLNITDIADFRSEDGSRKVTAIEPVALGEGQLITIEHAPYGVTVPGKPKPRVIRATYTVRMASDSRSRDAIAYDAVQRSFDRADFLAKSPEYYAEYRKYVLFLATRDEFESILQDFDKPEE